MKCIEKEWIETHSNILEFKKQIGKVVKQSVTSATQPGNPATQDHPKVPAPRTKVVQGHRPSKVLGEPEYTAGGAPYMKITSEMEAAEFVIHYGD